MLTDTVNEVSDYLFEESKKQAGAMLAELKSKGMEVVEITPEMKTGMREAAKTVVKMVKDAVGGEIVDDLLLAVQAASK